MRSFPIFCMQKLTKTLSLPSLGSYFMNLRELPDPQTVQFHQNFCLFKLFLVVKQDWDL